LPELELFNNLPAVGRGEKKNKQKWGPESPHRGTTLKRRGVQLWYAVGRAQAWYGERSNVKATPAFQIRIVWGHSCRYITPRIKGAGKRRNSTLWRTELGYTTKESGAPNTRKTKETTGI